MIRNCGHTCYVWQAASSLQVYSPLTDHRSLCQEMFLLNTFEFEIYNEMLFTSYIYRKTYQRVQSRYIKVICFTDSLRSLVDILRLTSCNALLQVRCVYTRALTFISTSSIIFWILCKYLITSLIESCKKDDWQIKGTREVVCNHVLKTVCRHKHTYIIRKEIHNRILPLYGAKMYTYYM